MPNQKFLGFYGYHLRAGDALTYYKKFCSIFDALNFPIKYHDFSYTLPTEKANHPGDFSSKKTTKNKLEDGIKSGEIVSFSIANEIYPHNNPDCIVASIKSESHGGSSLFLIFPDFFDYQKIHDDVAKMCRPEYGFSEKNLSSSHAILYTSTTPYKKNERNNFFIGKSGSIIKPRMVYEENYLSSYQLTPELLHAIEKLSGANALIKIGDDLFKWRVDSQDLDEFNRLLGEQELLISWCNPVRNRHKSG